MMIALAYTALGAALALLVRELWVTLQAGALARPRTERRTVLVLELEHADRDARADISRAIARDRQRTRETN